MGGRKLGGEWGLYSWILRLCRVEEDLVPLLGQVSTLDRVTRDEADGWTCTLAQRVARCFATTVEFS
jgi:hypothetical protein